MHKAFLQQEPDQHCGHTDFGEEVERFMSMVDGVALVLNLTEGLMAQTRFVPGNALKKS